MSCFSRSRIVIAIPISCLIVTAAWLSAFSENCENEDEDSLQLLQVGITHKVQKAASTTSVAAGRRTTEVQVQLQGTAADPAHPALCSADEEPVAKYWIDHVDQGACTGSGGLKEHEAWTFGWAGSFCAMQGAPAYQDAKMKTADGTFLYDAQWCQEAGLVDPPDKQQLLNDFGAIMAKTKEQCSTDDIKQTLATTTKEQRAGAEDNINAAIASQGNLNATDRKGFVHHKWFLETKAQQCQDGFYSCMVHFCVNYFCYLPDGSIGAGCMCNQDFKLNPIPPS